MAYKTESPTKSKKSLTRASANSRGYSSVLSGFSTSLSEVRKSLLSDAVAKINYEIEVNASSNEEKLALYENYLANLTPDTTEYYDTALKVQNLKDSLSTEDFNYAKALYGGNQISAENYYKILKDRVSEAGLSEKEKTQRTLELWDFETKVRDNATDDALREATLKESQGIISASDRLALIQKAYDAETDPARKQTLKTQLINQRDAAVREDQAYRELLVRKGIQEGTASKNDLVPIFVEKYQTAKTPNDALQAEIGLQNLIKDIQTDNIALFNQNSKDIKKSVKGLVADLDKKIDQAKRNGDIVGLKLLYDNKAGVIQEFMNSDAVTLDDKQSSSTMFSFLKDVYGKDVDVESGTVLDVSPSDPNNIQVVEDALNNPDSSLLVKSTSIDGTTSTNKLVRGVKTSVTKPDGTVESFYDFGKNVVVSRIDPSLTQQAIDPITGQVLKDKDGNPVMVGVNPVGRELKSLPDNYAQILQTGNLKPLPTTEFKGEYVDLYKDASGNMVRGYKVYGDKYKNILGAQPIAGEQGAYLLTTKDNQLPSQKYVKEQELYQPTIGNIIKDVPGNLWDFAKQLGPKASIEREAMAVQGVGDIANDIGNAVKKIDFSGLTKGIQNTVSQIKVPEIKIPDISKNLSNVSNDLQKQMLSSLFNPDVVLNTMSGNYNKAVSGAVNNFVKNSPVAQGVSSAASGVGNFFSNAFNTVKSWFGGK